MATQYAFGKIVTDGLVYAIDVADRNSYISGSSTINNLGSARSAGSVQSNLLYGGFFLTGSLIFTLPGQSSVFQTQAGTYDLWVQVPESNTTNAVVIYYDGGTSNNLVYLYRNPGFPTNSYNWLIYYTGSAGLGFYLPGITYTPYAWTNTTLVHTSTGTGSVYINGVLANTSNMSNFTQWNRSGLNTPSINMSSTGKQNGAFSNFKFYNRALSAQEVQQNYNAQKARFSLT
jgi:hypothetical protein